MNNRRIIAVSVVVVIIVVGLFIFLWLPGIHFSDESSRSTYEEIDLKFHGDISNSNGVAVDGYLTIEIYGIDRDGFSNVSVRLYNESGSLLGGSCVGRIVEGERNSVEYYSERRPEYVVFSSPSFWPETEDYPIIVDYYEYEDEEFRIHSALRPSSYPINVTRHDPCR